MKYTKAKKTELSNFFILGAVIFIGLFSVLFLKVNVKNCLYRNQTVLPSKSSETMSLKTFLFSSTPNITVINDNCTPYIVEDDIVNYTTSYYSLALPYNTKFYITKKETAETSKRLLIGLKQLYRQTRSNGVLKEHDIKEFHNLIDALDNIIIAQENIERHIKESQKDLTKLRRDKIEENIDLITSEQGELLIKATHQQDKLQKSLENQNNLMEYEAVVISNVLVDHILLNSMIIKNKYHREFLNKGYNYKEHGKPMPYNVIERIHHLLNTESP